MKTRIPNASWEWHIEQDIQDQRLRDGVGKLPPDRPVCERIVHYYPNTHGIPLEESGLLEMQCRCERCSPNGAGGNE